MKLLTVKKLFLQDFIKDTCKFSWMRLPRENFINDILIYQIVWRISISQQLTTTEKVILDAINHIETLVKEISP